MIRYWLPVRVLFYDVPHVITNDAVLYVMWRKERRKKEKHLSATAVVLILLGLAALAAGVRGALGAR